MLHNRFDAMIFYAMIVRSRDGLILSASTESECLREVKQSKIPLKLLGKRVATFPDRCTLKLNPLVIHFITSLGMTFMVLCESNYPCVLAFSFLNELMKEFITVYTTSQINNAFRPYAFIDFDNFVCKLRQRYNSPRTLTTKLNLPDLSTEIKLRPPHMLSMHDIQPKNNNKPNEETVAIDFTTRPVSCVCIFSLGVTIISALLNAIRGITALSQSNFEEYDGTNPLHGLSFLLEASTQCCQIYLSMKNTRRRILKTWVCFFLICMCNMLVWTLRDTWEILVHVAVASGVTLMILMRQKMPKAPQYNV